MLFRGDAALGNAVRLLRVSLQKAWEAFSGILPEFLMIIIATGLILAFVSSLMMVGVVTFSMERKTFGTRIALWRNSLAWLFSLAVAGVLAVMLGGVQPR